MISNEKFFYTVGYSEWGRWQVRKSSVDEPYKWTLIEDLGPELKDAYIEAEGNFVYLPGLPNIVLETELVPWLVVITTSGKLYAKRAAAPLETAVLLDTDVEEASVVRGWKSTEYDVDAGLIVAYRKQIGVYLRVYHPVSGSLIWDSAELLLSTAVNHVEVKRLNDFRIGVLADNKLLISDRYYIGGTAKTEYPRIAAGDPFTVIAMNAVDGPDDAFRIAEVLLVDMIEIWVSGNYPFYRLDPNWDDLSITSDISHGQGIDHYWIENGYLKIRLIQPLQTERSYVSFKIRAYNRIQFERTPWSRPVCPELNIEYIAPPVPFSEYPRVGVQGGQALIVGIQKRELSNSDYSDSAFIGVQGGTSNISEVQLNNLVNSNYSDSAFIGVQGGTGNITITQSGVTPI